MEHQYVDMYLRRKRSGHEAEPKLSITQPGTAATAIPAMTTVDTAGVERQSDRVVRGAFNVQQFVDRTESLAFHIDTFDDKMTNLTKLVKLSQSLQEEKDVDLRKQNQELKSRLKRQEQLTAKLSSEVEDLKGRLDEVIRAAIVSATNPILDDIASCMKAVQETNVSLERRITECRREQKLDMSDFLEKSVNARFAQLQEGSLERLHQHSSRLAVTMEGIEKRIDLVEGSKFNELRRHVDEASTSAMALSREKVLSEVKGLLKVQSESFKDDLSAQRSSHELTQTRLAGVERQSNSLDRAFTEFVSSFQESSRNHTAKAEEISHSVKEFMNLHEHTRSVVSTELENTKQWATRNLHRLKKHIDVIHADLTAIRESQVELSAQVQRVKCHAESEHEKLTTLLQQKSREANVLAELVDKEIQSIHQITQQHRAGIHSADPHSHHAHPPDPRAGQSRSLYDDLAFQRPSS